MTKFLIQFFNQLAVTVLNDFKLNYFIHKRDKFGGIKYTFISLVNV